MVLDVFIMFLMKLEGVRLRFCLQFNSVQYNFIYPRQGSCMQQLAPADQQIQYACSW